MNQTAVAKEFCNKVKEAGFLVAFKVKSSVQVAVFFYQFSGFQPKFLTLKILASE